MPSLPSNNITVELDLLPSFCNNWPELSITVNDCVLWQDYVTEKCRVPITFESQELNCVRISYLNKRNGPDIWDTKMDNNGNIVEDQNCVLKQVLINKARCDWIIANTAWTYNNGSDKLNHGFMDLQGHMDLCFPKDVYHWIIEKRQNNTPANTTKSSLDYKSIYVPQHENVESRAIIKDIRKLLSTLNV